MPYRSATQPLCRYCGKPIRKEPRTHWFGRSERDCERDRDSTWSRSHVDKPETKADVARLVNDRVLSVSRSYDRTYIDRASVWDGESYADGAFCTTQCAADMGRAAARAGQVMPAYMAAIRAREAKE